MSSYMKFENEREALLAALTFIDAIRYAPRTEVGSYGSQAWIIGESIRQSLPGLMRWAER